MALFAWGLWFVALFCIAGLIRAAPYLRSDCLIYFLAARNWIQGKDLFLYNYGIDGFLYFPQFAIIYVPFKLLGPTYGQIGWRIFGIALLTTGLWRVARLYAAGRAHLFFALATFAALPASVASLRNGEANLHIAGLMLHAAVDLSRKRWSLASFWLVFGLALKPIMIVMFLLAAAVYRPIIPRLIAGVIIAFFIPFALQHHDYVVKQYHDYLHWTQVATQPPNPFCNIRGLFSKMGWLMSQPTFKAIGVVAAAAALALSLLARLRAKEPWRSFYLLGFSAVYLMLFNPRTEANSYVILAPVVAIPAAAFLMTMARPRISIFLYVLAFMLFCDAWAYHLTEDWLKPLTCLVFGAFIIFELFSSHPSETVATPAFEFPAHDLYPASK